MQGDAVAKTGVQNVAQYAQNAVYSVNGGESITSKSNQVEFDNGVKATLVKASDKDVTISTGTDKLAGVNAAREMVNNFNKLLEAGEDQTDNRRAGRLVQELSGMSKTYSASLSRIGINVSKDGYLAIDEKKMTEASESGALQKFFEGNSYSNYGFANRLAKTAEQVSNNPTGYVDPKTLTQMNVSSYGDYYGLSYSQTYRMQQVSNMGLLFDSML